MCLVLVAVLTPTMASISRPSRNPKRAQLANGHHDANAQPTEPKRAATCLTSCSLAYQPLCSIPASGTCLQTRCRSSLHVQGAPQAPPASPRESIQETDLTPRSSLQGLNIPFVCIAQSSFIDFSPETQSQSNPISPRSSHSHHDIIATPAPRTAELEAHPNPTTQRAAPACDIQLPTSLNSLPRILLFPIPPFYHPPTTPKQSSPPPPPNMDHPGT